VLGRGFGGYDGQAASARCRFGDAVVAVGTLNVVDSDAQSAGDGPPLSGAQLAEAESLTCSSPVAISEPESEEDDDDWFDYDWRRRLSGNASQALLIRPAVGTDYIWGDGDTTADRSVWKTPLQVGLNGLDFRGAATFTYYHQALASVRCDDSVETTFGGRAVGGYPVTLVGEGFDGYDGNPATVRVRFGESDGSALQGGFVNSAGVNGSSDVAAVSVSATQVIVIAPEVSLGEGSVVTSRGYPCWAPPCRRVVLSLAINGLDFVGGAEEIEFYFFVADPWRAFNLLEMEFYFYCASLGGAILVNMFISWIWRFQLYDRYLSLKYLFMNKIWFRLA